MFINIGRLLLDFILYFLLHGIVQIRIHSYRLVRIEGLYAARVVRYSFNIISFVIIFGKHEQVKNFYKKSRVFQSEVEVIFQNRSENRKVLPK